MKTKAAILKELNSSLVIEELDLPGPNEGEVLVRIAASGICHTQLLEIKGENATGDHTPNLMGHEGAGIVESVGSGVAKVRKGDHVILSWIKGSGIDTCPQKIGELNRGPVTTFSEYSVVSENRVTPISKDVPLKSAALIGCAVATGAGMVLNNAKVQKGDSIMIIGCGGIGINAINAASIENAGLILAVDINDQKLELAKNFGATHTINPLNQNLEDKVKELAVDGFDYAIEAVGKKETLEFAYNNVKMNSGKAILCGVPNPPGQTIEIDPFPLYYGRKLVGTGGGETSPDEDFNKYVKMYLSGSLKLDEMISHTFALNEINKGIEALEKGKAIRVIIDMEIAK